MSVRVAISGTSIRDSSVGRGLIAAALLFITAAQEVQAMKGAVQDLASRALARKAERTGEESEGYLDEVCVEMPIIDKLWRIPTLAKRIAKTVVPDERSGKD